MQISRSRNFRPRTLEPGWREAARQFPVLLLTGPRQVGKPTLLDHLRESERRYVTFDDLDFVLEADGVLFPVEVKKSTRVERAEGLFSPTSRLGAKVGAGAVVCLYPQVLPIDDKNTSVPVGIL